MSKTADDYMAESAKLRAKARAAEKAEFEQFGRLVAERYGRGGKGVSARIAAASRALGMAEETADRVGHASEGSGVQWTAGSE